MANLGWFVAAALVCGLGIVLDVYGITREPSFFFLLGGAFVVALAMGVR